MDIRNKDRERKHSYNTCNFILSQSQDISHYGNKVAAHLQN